MNVVSRIKPNLRSMVSPMLALGVAGFAVGLVSTAAQQKTDPAPAREAGARPARAAHAGAAWDRHFAECLTIDNQNEVALAELAQRKTGNADVKKFAETLQKDHQQAIQELEKFTSEASRSRRDRRDARNDARNDDETNRTDRSRREERAADRQAATIERNNRARERQQAAAEGRGVTHHGDETAAMLEIKEEIAEECLASAKRELEDKDSSEFDACYIGMQIAAHMHMVDELKVLERHASSELQPVLRKSRETAQAHLDRAKEIIKDVSKLTTAASSTSSKTE